MNPERRACIERIFDAFARRDLPALQAEAPSEFVFRPVTGGEVGRTEPYRGHAGLAEYIADVERAWQELQLRQHSYEERDDHVLVVGRVWARGSRHLTDSPAAWLWHFDGAMPVECQVFDSEPEALAAFAKVAPTSVDQA